MMSEIYAQIVASVHATWRRRWYAIAIAWLVSGAGWVSVATMPDQYQSNARIYIDMDSMLGPLMRGLAVQTNIYRQIDVMQRTLLSRPNLEKVLLLTDLDLRVRNEEDRERLIEEVRSKIALSQQGHNLFRVAYSDTNPETTRRVVQAVLQIFVESNLGASRQDMDSTRRFLEDQLREYERQLEAAEDRRAKFKRQNMGFMPGEGNYYQQMQRMKTQLENTKAQLAEAVTVRDELRLQIQSIPEYLDVTGSELLYGPSGGPEAAIQHRILEMEKLVDELLTRYTEQHPDVVSVKRRIESLRAQLQGEREAAEGGAAEGATREAGSGRAIVPNPLFEKIKLQLVQQEATIAALGRRVEREEADLDRWGQMAALVPQVEAELVRLDRDYGILRSGYDQLRARQESARLARDLETKAQKVQFRVIDPPRVPTAPSGPNRAAFFTSVLLVALGAGGAVAFLLGHLNTTFPNPQQLRAKFALPVLGSVSTILSARERKRSFREIFGFAMVTAALLLAYGGLVAIDTLGRAAVIESVRGLGIAV